MKKGLSLLLALAMVLAMAGCSLTFINRSDGESAKDPADPPAAVEPEEPAVPEVPEAPVQAEEPSIPDPEEPAVPDEETGGEAETDQYVIYFGPTDVTLKFAGETFDLFVWDSEGADPDVCTYTSADPSIASVDETGGRVTAVAPGTTTIAVHAEFGGEKKDFSCIVRCNWADEAAEPSQPVSGAASLPSLTDFFATLQDKYDGLGAMMVMEGELLSNYYPGLDAIAAVEEIYIQETMISMANVAVGMVKLSADATTDDVTAVQNILQARIDTQAAGGAWYPESCETWEQGVITSTSNVVGMFVYPDEAQAMADLFTETFSN